MPRQLSPGAGSITRGGCSCSRCCCLYCILCLHFCLMHYSLICLRLPSSLLLPLPPSFASSCPCSSSASANGLPHFTLASQFIGRLRRNCSVALRREVEGGAWQRGVPFPVGSMLYACLVAKMVIIIIKIFYQAGRGKRGV